MLTHEQLFLLTLEDLRSKLASGKEYDLIRACGLCRHLILDDIPLVHLVNRRHRIKLRFEVAFNNINKFFQTSTPHGLNWVTFDPGVIRNLGPTFTQVRKISLEEFQKFVVLHYQQNAITVRHLIRAASHCLGGIHSSEPAGSEEKALVALNAAAEKDGPLTKFAIKTLCSVILKAMEPIEGAIQRSDVIP
jgi:hypothetical protein